MELLLELLLTVVSSVLIAFLFSKIVAMSSSNGKDQDAHLPAEGFLSFHRRSSKSAATHGIEGEAEVNRELFEGLDEARERAETCRDECIETRFEESIHLVEQHVKKVVGGFHEARAEDLGILMLRGNPDARVAETEENSGKETSEDGIESVASGMTVEEKPPTEDGDRKINFSLSLDEEEAFQGPDIREVGTESVIGGAGDALVETVDVKVPKTDTAGSMFNDEDEWEGIEKSDIEKLFGAAAEFVGSTEGNEALSELSNDLQMLLFGLRKIATEGPCYESQPLALKVSARAKWHAWQRLGSMNPEEAMEKYVALLSDNVPRWMSQKHRTEDDHLEGEDSISEGTADSGVGFSSSQLQDQINERKLETHSYSEECDVDGISEGIGQGHHA